MRDAHGRGPRSAFVAARAAPYMEKVQAPSNRPKAKEVAMSGKSFIAMIRKARRAPARRAAPRSNLEAALLPFPTLR